MAEDRALEEVTTAREALRAGEALPHWTSTQWTNATLHKLGQVAFHVHMAADEEGTERDRAYARERAVKDAAATAAVLMDFIEASTTGLLAEDAPAQDAS